MSALKPTDEEVSELLLSCRYGDLEDVQQFIAKYGSGADSTLDNARDDNGNTVLHMCCANGHLDVLDYLLPLVTPDLLRTQNSSKSTALHWATINSHLDVAKKLVDYPQGPGADLIEIKNAAGLSPLGEAERAGWDEGAQWFVSVMKLDGDQIKEGVSNTDEDEDAPLDPESEITVEIQDVDGQMARMTLNGDELKGNSDSLTNGSKMESQATS